MMIEPYDPQVLFGYQKHCLEQAGAAHLMAEPLMQALAEHTSGNLRMLNTMAAELLEKAAQKELLHLDEKLFLETFSPLQIAFTLWEQLASIEDLLWDRYYKEFLELILEKQERPKPSDDTQEFVF